MFPGTESTGVTHLTSVVFVEALSRIFGLADVKAVWISDTLKDVDVHARRKCNRGTSWKLFRVVLLRTHSTSLEIFDDVATYGLRDFPRDSGGTDYA